MQRLTLLLILFTLSLSPTALLAETPVESNTESESVLLSKTRQLTFAGRRSGEGYFSADGTKLVFQSEREAGNPFFQIYLLDLETGDETRISPGTGKTTCAWIHPDGNRVLFASTQDDPEALEKQKAELELRESGKERRYSWDYDPEYNLFQYDLKSKEYQPLTKERGYDAEGSYSPDGKLIAFASNRDAYQRELTDEEQAMLERDPAVFMEIYVMEADGSNVRKLTDTLGYDGGPFFSPDGKRICWRRFKEDGATAEIMTMNIDGSDVRQLTHWKVMSWAPYYHPSGRYIIFTTNRHGFANFELYMVATNGKSDPIRVTHTEGFDGLPAFSPDGNQLTWTTNRSGSKQSQIYLADWNHEAALELLSLTGFSDEDVEQSAAANARDSADSFEPADIARHVNFLCREELAGRLTGTEGEHLATQYVATYFEELGLKPGGDDETWFQEFEFTAGIDLGENNSLTLAEKEQELDKSWNPVSFSANGEFSGNEYAFAGYGIVAPAIEKFEEYDSYVHLDVKDKWVVVFRFLPEGITPELRQHWARYSSLRYKAMVARDHGAKGLIVVSGPASKVRNQLVPLRYDGSLAGTSIPVISLNDELAGKLLSNTNKTLIEWQTQLDPGEPVMGFVTTGPALNVQVDIEQVKRTGRNVIGVLPAKQSYHPLPAILVGAHVDHLGRGGTSSSLANEKEADQIHYGADDNASGTGGMLEIAEYMSSLVADKKIELTRDVIFVAWSGEELGLYGANHFVKELEAELNSVMESLGGTPEKEKTESGEEETSEAQNNELPLRFVIGACLNMDMIGRFDKALILQGVGSSTAWKSIIEQRNVPVGMPITLQNDSYIPTDASVFFMHGVPILSAFTGTHTDYHTPRDTPEKINYQAASEIAHLMGLITRGLAVSPDTLDYVDQARPEEQRRANLRAYLGTIPDYGASDVKGVQLSGVGKGGPADKAGMTGGDVIIELAGKKIENIYDYTYAIEALKIGEKVKIVIQRDGEKKTLELIPGSRE
ncbi:M28 family peptidase [uncultured Rubinisphaera sp.]|uniref:M28 family peptidase n=1 Tax=uncultured Rubinisphaera sp. TaxID=1678686 RepID=UPI0030D899A2